MEQCFENLLTNEIVYILFQLQNSDIFSKGNLGNTFKNIQTTIKTQIIELFFQSHLKKLMQILKNVQPTETNEIVQLLPQFSKQFSNIFQLNSVISLINQLPYEVPNKIHLK